MYFERISGARIDTKINGFLEGFSKDSRSYVGQMPKATTLDPFENFRVNRRVRRFRLVLKFNKKHWKIHQISFHYRQRDPNYFFLGE